MEYLEKLRTENMKKGFCQLCGSSQKILERHHEKYEPERTIFICHKCHHKLHFLPNQLPERHKEKLLQVRLQTNSPIPKSMIHSYLAPGRRDAQLALRRHLKESQKK